LPLNYYPRPYLERDSWINLNGIWNYTIQRNISIESILTKDFEIPNVFNKEIKVPYAIETFASLANEQLYPSDLLWYHRSFKIEKKDNHLVILNFEKVDQECTLYINKKKVGSHSGGYLPFSFDITNYLIEEDNDLILLVKDYTNTSKYPFGKQSINRGGIFYTPTSGIYDTVWLEQVPIVHIKDINFITNPDTGEVKVSSIKVDDNIPITITIDDINYTTNKDTFIIDKPKLWSIDKPYLYKVKVNYLEDSFISYLSFRKVESLKSTNPLTANYLAVNGKPLILNGVLDQGYYSSSGLTPINLEEMLYDIEEMKRLGFNCIRKHIKIESRRYYYECDRLGIYLIQDFPCVFKKLKLFYVAVMGFLGKKYSDKKIRTFSGVTNEMMEQFKLQLNDTISLLSKHPSIVTWTVFNESWGQFETKSVTDQAIQLDNTRLVDSTSGWFDLGYGHFHSIHKYLGKYKLKRSNDDRIEILSEYGGLTLLIKDTNCTDKVAGYAKFKTKKELSIAYLNLHKEQIIPAVQNGLAGIIYTQVSDVEDELNGIMTFDRNQYKIEEDVIISINKEIRDLENLIIVQ
jgi:beta-galactosidase/beta-glucuronidase